ncbi:hypothetical protein [Nocardia sp. NPDC052112]|uniref:hypothetical protein n=1 Tax=Nocardia sp. NPDC052112 TaxID=3155646 RepID=UPI0034468C07
MCDDTGGYHGRMAVLVKPNGPLGRALYGRNPPVPVPAGLYPALMRGIERE